MTSACFEHVLNSLLPTPENGEVIYGSRGLGLLHHRYPGYILPLDQLQRRRLGGDPR